MEKFIKETIKEAGKIILEGFESELEIGTKSHDHDFVTQYDRKVEDFIVEQIQSNFPEVGIIGEERGEIKKADKFFLIDPIDGTANFTRNIPLSSIIMGYVENDEVMIGAVYDPYRDELFFSKRGEGATLNDKKIQVSTLGDFSPLRGHLIAIDTYFPGTKEKYAEKLKKAEEKIGFRRFTLGSAGLNLAYAACFRLDFSAEVGLAPWDLAGCSLILEEAGAKITDIDGGVYRWNSESLIAAEPKLHDQLMKAIHG